VDDLARAVSDRPVVVLSHRGPVSFRRGPDGSRSATRGAGGLVTALAGVADHLDDLVWVCAAATDEDRAVRAEAGGRAVRVSVHGVPRLLAPGDGRPSAPDERSLAVRLVDVPAEQHEPFYSVIANPLLWFLQHGMWDLALAPDITAAEHRAFEDGYVPVNELFAEAVIEEVQSRRDGALVLLQDYHYYLVAPLVRQACPTASLTHFVHIPWPGPDAWRVLPRPWRERLLRGLLGNDVVGFHTVGFARNFVSCASELLGLPVDLAGLTIDLGDRLVHARHYPISIDVAGLHELARGPKVAERARALREEYSERGEDHRLVLRVDRTDPSKNIVRGFRAFATMLDSHPELVGRVTFLALLQPSRQDVPEYADYLAAIGAEVARVNARYASSGSHPIDLRLVEDLPLAVAAYTVCDVLMVNALADGMNLVAKEAVAVGRPDLVLLLSENTGAHAELGAFAITLHPFDVQQQADALFEALTLPTERRRQLHEAAADVVATNDVRKWLANQLADLSELASDP
jgi:trehalose 6-phosphate synthase